MEIWFSSLKSHYGLCVCSTSLHLWSDFRHAQDIALNVTHSSSSKSPRPAWPHPAPGLQQAACPLPWLVIGAHFHPLRNTALRTAGKSKPPPVVISILKMQPNPSFLLPKALLTFSSLILLFPSLHLHEIPSKTLAAVLHLEILIWNSSPNSRAPTQPIANIATQHALTWRVVSNHCSPKPTAS